MDRFEEADLFPLSALQHYAYCPRQCALIHIDGLWSENELTVEGRHLHESVDSDGPSERDGVRTTRGLRIRSLHHGIVGKADVVEFSAGPPRPVEYKRGRPKANDADRIQLCAQALCLEEMLDTEVPEGDLFYGQTRRRERVAMSSSLRAKTVATIDAVRAQLDAGIAPRAAYEKRKCDRCSLKNLCLPNGTAPSRSASRYLSRALGASLADEGDVEDHDA